MNLIDQATTEKSALPYRDWATQVRKDRLPTNMDEYLKSWADFCDDYASTVEKWRRTNAEYHRNLASLAQFYIPEGSSVLEVGSGMGDLLAATRPRPGVGIDLSGRMVQLAQKKYPDLEFQCMAAENLDLGGEKFDYIILSDLVGLLFDIRLALARVRSACHSETRVVMNWNSQLWQPILVAAEQLGLRYPQPSLNWTTVEDMENLLHLTDYEVIGARRHILIPKRFPVLAHLANRYVANFQLVRHLCLTNWIVARPLHLDDRPMPRVTVVCPCRNEAGNIRQVVERLPAMGAQTELILVEGHSSDDTLAVCQKIAVEMPERNITVLVQEGRGKGDAVRLGFPRAKGDILMILDADVSVPPEDLVYFYEALVSVKGEFINGCRLVYTMDPKAMRFLNLLGKRFFALLLSSLIGQPIKDTLCGTKALWRSRYEESARGRAYFGSIDPFGEFDLLFGAAKLKLKIIEVPTRYRQRTYGTTNISRFADGWLLLRMSAKAAKKLFFIN